MAFNRCNVIANELAKIKGEDFIMPKRSIQSTYIDNHGTNEVYNYLSTQVLGQYDDIDAKISIQYKSHPNCTVRVTQTERLYSEF